MKKFPKTVTLALSAAGAIGLDFATGGMGSPVAMVLARFGSSFLGFCFNRGIRDSFGDFAAQLDRDAALGKLPPNHDIERAAQEAYRGTLLILAEHLEKSGKISSGSDKKWLKALCACLKKLDVKKNPPEEPPAAWPDFSITSDVPADVFEQLWHRQGGGSGVFEEVLRKASGDWFEVFSRESEGVVPAAALDAISRGWAVTGSSGARHSLSSVWAECFRYQIKHSNAASTAHLFGTLARIAGGQQEILSRLKGDTAVSAGAQEAGVLQGQLIEICRQLESSEQRMLAELAEIKERIPAPEDLKNFNKRLDELSGRLERSHKKLFWSLGALGVVVALGVGGALWAKSGWDAGEIMGATRSVLSDDRAQVDRIIRTYTELQGRLTGEWLPADESWKRAMAQVAAEGKIPVQDLEARVNVFVSAIKADARADSRDKARVDFVERVALEVERKAAFEAEQKAVGAERAALEAERKIFEAEKSTLEAARRAAVEAEKRAAEAVKKAEIIELERRITFEAEKRVLEAEKKTLEAEKKTAIESGRKAVIEAEKRASVEVEKKTAFEAEQKAALEMERRVLAAEKTAVGAEKMALEVEKKIIDAEKKKLAEGKASLEAEKKNSWAGKMAAFNAGADEGPDLLGKARTAFEERRFGDAADEAEKSGANAEKRLADAAGVKAAAQERELGALRLLFESHEMQGRALAVAGNFDEAVNVYFKALRRITRENAPVQWAKLQVLQGKTFSVWASILEGSAAGQRRQQAVAAYRAAMEVYTRRQFPTDWAKAKNSLGNELKHQAGTSRGVQRSQLLDEAVEAYRAALVVYSRKDTPKDWALVQKNLADALCAQAEADGGAQRGRLFGEAVQVYRAALEIYTGKDFPQEWCMTQNSLCVALAGQAMASEDDERERLLGEAMQASRALIEVNTQRDFPRQWAKAQNNLGNMLRLQAKMVRSSRRERLLEEAVQCYRHTLGVYTRQDAPQQWALTQSNLGVALREQARVAKRDERERLLGEAAQACRSALEVRTEGDHPREWSRARSSLGFTLRDQSETKKGEQRANLLKESADCFDKAVKGSSSKQASDQADEVRSDDFLVGPDGPDRDFLKLFSESAS